MGGDDRVGSGGDDDCVCLEHAPVCLDASGTGDPARLLGHSDAALLVASDLLRVVVVRDHVVAVRGEARPVECGRSDAGGSRALTLQLGRAEQRLRRDAAPVGAFAADQLLLDESDLQIRLRQRVERDLACGACAEDDDVEFLGHVTAPVFALAWFVAGSGSATST
jgi:hypothetical protein